MAKTIKQRLEDLEAKQQPPAILVIVPSWGDHVTIGGVEVPKSEYKRDPSAQVITLSWGDDDKDKSETKTE